MIEIIVLLAFALGMIPMAALIVFDIEYEKYLKEKYKWKAKR